MIRGNQLLQIINDYGWIVSSLCRKMIQDEETAKDAAQEAWIAISKGIGQYAGESRLSTWIYSVASHAILRHAQKEKMYTTRFLVNFFHGPEREFPADANQDKDLWVRSMCDKCLTGILHCLDNETRLAYVLRDIAELDYLEIATILGLTQENVRKQISRARAKLKTFLNNECALQNPNGTCRCRMKKLVEGIDLPSEYQKLRDIVNRISTFKASMQILPRHNFWSEKVIR